MQYKNQYIGLINTEYSISISLHGITKNKSLEPVNIYDYT